FIGAGGIQGYARNLGTYQGDIFAILSLRAWNPWWLLQELRGGGQFLSDQGAVLGPITLRHVGYGLALFGELAVFLAVYRAPTARSSASRIGRTSRRTPRLRVSPPEPALSAV